MDNPARVAVIGCGAIAHEHLAFLSTSPKIDLVAVCDRSDVTARFMRDRFRAREAFTDVAELLDRAKPDVAHILTPPNTHKSLVEQMLRNAVHVICEKPLSESETVTQSLLDLAHSSKCWLIESRNLLYNDEIIRARKEIDDGTLGEIREVDVSISLDILSGPFGDLNLEGPGVDLPAGAIHDFLPHMAYLFLDLIQRQPEEFTVTGTLANLSGNRRAGFDFLDCLLIAGKKRGRLRFASDINPASFRIVVRGTRGVLETDIYHSFVWIQTQKMSGKLAPFEAMSSGLGLFKSGVLDFRNKVLQHNSYHGLRRMLDAIYSAMRNGQEAPITPEDIRATAHLIDKIVALKADA